MPGRSFSSRFASVAWSWMLRVSASTSGFTVVMRPSIVRPGRASQVTRTGRPGRSWARCCWGRAKLTKMGSRDCSVTIGSPSRSICPRFTCRMPRRPLKGARIVFLPMSGADVVGLGRRLLLVCGGGVVVGLRDDPIRQHLGVPGQNGPGQLSPGLWRRRAGPLPSRCPGGSAGPPSAPFPPGWKAISTIFPGSSAATVTPWTATSDPTAVREISQDADPATAVVTASGGGTAFLACFVHRPELQRLDGDERGDEDHQA